MNDACCERCRYWLESHVPQERRVDSEDIRRYAELMQITAEQAVEIFSNIDEMVGHNGFCRRFPPTNVVWAKDDMDARQPHTDAKDWCGEFRP